MKKLSKSKKVMRTIELVVLYVILIVIVLILGIHTTCVMLKVSGSFLGLSSQTIMYSKEQFYKLNNEGIQGCKVYYDDITIQTPNDEDKVIVFNDGLKYVKYPDLMILYLKDDFGDDKVEICNGVYIEKHEYSYRYLEIKVDREYVSNITYYEYQKKIISVPTSETSKTLQPNTYYKWGTMTSLTITLATNVDSSILNEYMFEFVSGTTPTTLSLPSSIKWLNGEAPIIEQNKTYQVSIVNNLAIICLFS